MTKTYVGAKIVKAWPQSEPFVEPTDDDPAGIRPPREGYGVKYADDHVSWSPKDVFEEAYREVPDEEAASILEGARAEIERLANGGALFDAIESADDERRQRDIRNTALHLAVETIGSHPLPFDMKLVFDRASMIAVYINDGVVSIPQEPARVE